MSAVKTIFLLSLFILSQVASASEWTHLNFNQSGFGLKLSYTKTYQPATYGSMGGLVHGRAFIDLTTSVSTVAQTVEIFRIAKSGQLSKVQTVQLREDTGRHFWGQLQEGPTYGNFLMVGQSYLFKVSVDGKVLEYTFKMI